MNIAGIPIVIEGDGPETIVMLHGWPDTYRIWSRQAQHFAQRYRCVRFTLPGFSKDSDKKSDSLPAIIDTLRQIVDAVSPEQKVTLMLHDWGCVFGYQFAMQFPERVARIVAIDIGDAGSPIFQKSLSWSAKGMIAAYQVTLAVAWYAGDFVGTRITRGMAKALKAKAASEQIHAGMNYPYAMLWMRARGGLRGLYPVAPSCPVFYGYGRKKPFMFHSAKWLEHLRSQPGNRVQAFSCGHWVMVDRAEEFNAAVDEWLTEKT